jgi:hypothetical protein
MSAERVSILARYGVTNPADLPPMERLRWANAPSEEAVRMACSIQTDAPDALDRYRLPNDPCALAFDGVAVSVANLGTADRLRLVEALTDVAAERYARHTGNAASMSDDEYHDSLARLAPFLTEDWSLIANRMMAFRKLL